LIIIVIEEYGSDSRFGSGRIEIDIENEIEREIEVRIDS
jgi:hypothetical protein